MMKLRFFDPKRLASALHRVAQHRYRRHPAARAAGRVLGLLTITLIGLSLGVLLAGSVVMDIGPFHARYSIVPSLSGGSEVSIPPLGSLHIDSHVGPAHLWIQLESLDEAKTRDLVSDPNGIVSASESAVDDLAAGVRTLAMQVAGAGLLGAMILAGLVYRSMRRVATAGGIALGVLVASGGLVAATFRPDAIQEPRYEGLLINAPAVVGDVKRIADQYEEYRDQLQRLVQNVSRLYGTFSTLPVYEPDTKTTRVVHISDMHLNPAAWSVVQTVVQQFRVDMVVDTGDLVDWGSEPEDSYVNAIAQLKVPYLYIRGNHDSTNTEAAVARQPNAHVLTNSVVTVEGLSFAGIGDPRFTPDKETVGSGADLRLVRNTGASLAGRIRASDVTVDVALVHDPASADLLAFSCPLVLAGHTHKRTVSRIDGPTGTQTFDRTMLMVQGSTGGAGLRGLERSEPLSLAFSVLYFDEYRSLKAYDDITVGGTGLSQVSLERHIVAPDEPEDDEATPAPSAPGSIAPINGEQPSPTS
ncbi:MAG: metallophosphoesterase [Dactylosporangium sp.]|nr:metallophosphoesterase [Dactylosporangium sp.]NNJ60327.1 metallophosphoesterase [Dactylosporangium sp.]